jgi:hypothetical protein
MDILDVPLKFQTQNKGAAVAKAFNGSVTDVTLAITP